MRRSADNHTRLSLTRDVFFFFYMHSHTSHTHINHVIAEKRHPGFLACIVFFFFRIFYIIIFLFLATFPSSFCFYLLLVRLPVSRSQPARSSRRAYISRVETRQSKLTGISHSKSEKTKTPMSAESNPARITRYNHSGRTSRFVGSTPLSLFIYHCY